MVKALFYLAATEEMLSTVSLGQKVEIICPWVTRR